MKSYVVFRDGKQIATALASSLTATVPAPAPGQSHVYKVEALDACTTSKDGPSTTVNLPLPKDPATTKPTLIAGEISSFCERNDFLWSGVDAVQTGTSPGAIGCGRVAILRGRVITCDGKPASGARVSVPLQPDVGFTYSRADGMFDLAVNGGGEVTIRYEREGSPAVDRRVRTHWRQFSSVPEVVLVPYDATATPVDLNAIKGFAVARGGVVTDGDGTRQATVLFPEGEKASLRGVDGKMTPITMLHVRATEYTVGACGPKAMPGPLPPSSAYTYAVEFSVDEAVEAGAVEVAFEKPVISYTENFLGFPVGTAVPVGIYERESSCWVPQPNGRVVEVKAVVDGVADLDTDGDGKPDGDGAAAVGISKAERTTLGSLYKAGQQLWRAEVPHFSPADLNWSLATYPPLPDVPDPAVIDIYEDDCERAGSVIGCHGQTLGEAIPLAGVGQSLVYSSSRKSLASMTIPVSGASVPAGTLSMDVRVEIAGQVFFKAFPATPNQSWTVTWDGNDAFGSPVYGAEPVDVTVTWYAPAPYALPTDVFGSYPGGGLLKYVKEREAIGTIKTWSGRLTARPPHDRSGWTLSEQHRYDPNAHAVYYGNGQRRTLTATASDNIVIDTLAGTGTCGFSGDGGPAKAAAICGPTGVVAAPDGSVYVADFGNYRIRRIDPDGKIHTVAGTGQESPCAGDGDGGDALKARIQPGRMALDCAGNLFFVDRETRVRRIDRNGIITTVVGSGCAASSPPTLGLPGPSTSLWEVVDVAAGADCRVYVADNNAQLVMRVDPDGIVRPVVGDGSGGQPKLGKTAVNSPLPIPWAMAGTDDGTVFVAGGSGKPGETAGTGPWDVYRVGRDGLLQLFAGDGPLAPPPPDGASSVGAYFTNIDAMAGAASGGLYVANSASPAAIYSLGLDGKARILAGGSPAGLTIKQYTGDGGPARNATLDTIRALAVGPDGSVYAAGWADSRVLRIHRAEPKVPPASASAPASPGAPPPPPGPTSDGAEVVVPSEDGSVADVFDGGNGRHLRTVDPLSGMAVKKLAYDATGLLASVSDQFGNTTKLVRNKDGQITSIVSPWGVTTKLAYDAGGWLVSSTNDANETYQVSHAASGLLSSFTTPNGKTYTFAYDPAGNLIKDADPAGGEQTVTRTGTTTTVSTKLGHATKYDRKFDDAKTRSDTVTGPDGVSVLLKTTSAGVESTTSAEGSVAEKQFVGDPVFGAIVPRVQKLTLQTGGGAQSFAVDRSAQLLDLADPLSTATATTTVTIGSAVWTVTYDRAARKISATSPSGKTATMTYDEHGLLTSSSRPGVAPTNYAYDAQGRLSTITHGSRVATRTYDARGFIATLTDPLGRTESFERDAVGRVTKRFLADGKFITFSHDKNGNTTSVTPPSRPAYSASYDAVDAALTVQVPAVPQSSGLTSVAYDDDHAVMSVARPDAKKIMYGRDTAGRVDTIVLPGTEGTISVAYDPATGRVVSTQGPGLETIKHTYNGALLTSQSWSGDVTGMVSWAYDAQGHVLTESVGNFQSALFKYDADGQLTQAGGILLGREGATGRIKSATAGGVVETFEYDGTYGHLDAISSTLGATSLLSATYGRDAVGRIKTKTETVLGVATTTAYDYDTRGQLIDVTVNGAAAAHYDYDANGALKSRTSGGNTTVAVVDAQDRLVSYGATTYAYAADGQLTTKTDGTSTTTYTYDAMGALRSVALPSGSTVSYVIDPRGRRVGRKVDGAITHRFVYRSALQLAAVVGATGEADQFFVYGSRKNVPDYIATGFSTYRLVTDHLGSVRLVVDALGNVVQRLDYDERGRVTTDTNPGFQPFGYAGGLYDPATGLVRFGARDYDAETGRWTAPDPLGFGGGDANLYRYAQGDPVNFVDASGEFPWGPLVAGAVVLGSGLMISSSDDQAQLAIAGAVALRYVPSQVWLGLALASTTQIQSSNDTEGHMIAAALGAGAIGRVKCPVQNDTALLEEHLAKALETFEKEGLTPKQALAAAKNPKLEPAFRGDRIDKFFKESVQNDPRLSHLKVTPRFKFGPDVYDPNKNVWWDVTTQRHWAAHVAKYGNFGEGTGLIYLRSWMTVRPRQSGHDSSQDALWTISAFRRRRRGAWT